MAALALDLIGIGGWLLAFFGPFPPHPWIFFLLAALALVSGAAGIVIACIGHMRSASRSRWSLGVIAFGVAPLIVVAVAYSVMFIEFVVVVQSSG